MRRKRTPEVVAILRACAAEACEKIEAAGLVPLTDFRWLNEGSVYVRVMWECVRSAGPTTYEGTGMTIRISDHSPAPGKYGDWSIHPGCSTDIDSLVNRARREFRKWENERRSRLAKSRSVYEAVGRRAYRRADRLPGGAR